MASSVLELLHPKYIEHSELWSFLYESYVGGKQYFKKHLVKHYKEGDLSYDNRIDRASRENYSRSIVDTINSYLFKEQASRHTEDKKLEEFFLNVDGQGREISQFMKSASILSSIFGRVYIVVDKTTPETKTGTKKDDHNSKCYAYTVSPLAVKDVAFDEFGRITWILIEEVIRDDEDPFSSSLEVSSRYRLWTKTGWTLYDESGIEIDSGKYSFGRPPVTYIDTGEKLDAYNGTSLIFDIAYLDKSIFNNVSRLDCIISDQTFSQLIFPIEGLIIEELVRDEELKKKFLNLAVGNILFYSARSEGAKPEYISPDASQAEIVLATIKHQIRQIYSSIGLQTPDSHSENYRSGVSKQYDFDKLNKLLAGKADSIELAETHIVEFFNDWMGFDCKATINYPDEFDIRSLADEIILGQELMLLDISETFNKVIRKNIAIKSMPKEKKEVVQEVLDEIEAKEELPLNETMDLEADDFKNKLHAEKNKKIQQLTQTKYRIEKNLS